MPETHSESTGAAGGGVSILVLVGATAVGKTGVAVDLCRWLGGEIVGADSVQVYRGLDIGSAKPSLQSLMGIRHHLIDVADPDAPLDAAAFARLADQAIDEVVARGSVPVVVGGTGLWLRALVRGLVAVPPVDEGVRESLHRQFERLGAAEMHRRLAGVDPTAAARIHPHDRVRVVRALEVYELTGTPVGELRRRHALAEPRYRTLCFDIDIPPAHLKRRLVDRARAMIEAGWADEVRGLVQRYGPEIRPLRSVGYRQMVEHVLDDVPLEDTEHKIVKATRQYARRQRTWFKSDPDVDAHISPADLTGDPVRRRIEAHLAATPGAS